MEQVCVVINKCFATAGKENVNVLQVTAPCLSVVCVKGGYNMYSGATHLLSWQTYLCLSTSTR